MSRPIEKIDLLDLDIISNIKKLCNGNLATFKHTYLSHMQQSDFYSAMQYEPSTPYTVAEITHAYTEARMHTNLSDEELSTLPTIQHFLKTLVSEFYTCMYSNTIDSIDIIEKNHRQLKFYSDMLDNGTIILEKGKKSILT